MMPYRLARLVITDIDITDIDITDIDLNPQDRRHDLFDGPSRLNLIFRSSRPFLTLATAR
jgi:hypothetical protein